MKLLYYNYILSTYVFGVAVSRATVKTGMQERGTDIMWFHTRNCTEITQEVSHNQQ